MTDALSLNVYVYVLHLKDVRHPNISPPRGRGNGFPVVVDIPLLPASWIDHMRTVMEIWRFQFSESNEHASITHQIFSSLSGFNSPGTHKFNPSDG